MTKLQNTVLEVPYFISRSIEFPAQPASLLPYVDVAPCPQELLSVGSVNRAMLVCLADPEALWSPAHTTYCKPNEVWQSYCFPDFLEIDILADERN